VLRDDIKKKKEQEKRLKSIHQTHDLVMRP
jgi:hypothetical protein